MMRYISGVRMHQWQQVKHSMRAVFAIAMVGVMPAMGFAAAFDDLGAGARSFGLAGAYTAVAEDASAIYWNPAMLAKLEKREMTFSHQDIFSLGLLNYQFFGYAYPGVGKGALGFGLARMGTTDAVSFLDYTESTYMVSYGKRISEDMYVGGTVKYLSVAYEQRASGMAFDVAMAYDIIYEKLHAGLMARNVNRPQVRWETGATDTIEPTVTLGLNYFAHENHSVVLDMNQRSMKIFEVGLAWEGRFLNDLISLRVGGATLNDVVKPTAGIGISYKKIVFDYALEYHEALGLNSVLAVSLKM